MTVKFSQAEREQALGVLPGWRMDTAREAIVKTFVFTDFVQAFGFMSQVALISERMDHHPEWSNVYRTVHVLLTTHDAHGLTQKDADLAREMDRIATRLGT